MGHIAFYFYFFEDTSEWPERTITTGGTTDCMGRVTVDKNANGLRGWEGACRQAERQTHADGFHPDASLVIGSSLLLITYAIRYSVKEVIFVRSRADCLHRRLTPTRMSVRQPHSRALKWSCFLFMFTGLLVCTAAYFFCFPMWVNLCIIYVLNQNMLLTMATWRRSSKKCGQISWWYAFQTEATACRGLQLMMIAIIISSADSFQGLFAV